MSVVDADLKDGQLASAGKLLDRLSQVIPGDSIAVLARRLQLMKLSGDDSELEALSRSFVTGLVSATPSDLAAMRPEIIGMAPSIMGQYVQYAPDDQAASRSVAVVGLIRRLLATRSENENLWPLVRLAEVLIAVNVQQQKMNSDERQQLLGEFVETGKWLLESEHYPRHLTPEFVVLLYHSAIAAVKPEFAVEILPQLVEQRDDDSSWQPTDEQRDALITYHLTAMALVLGTDAEGGVRAGVDRLRTHADTTSMAHLLQAVLSAHDGNPDQAREHLTKAAEDNRIDRQLILAVRCRCETLAENWKEIADAFEQMKLAEVDERQAAFLNAILGSRERRQLTRAMALMESGRPDEADDALKSLDGTELFALGQLMRVLHVLRQGQIVRARELLDSVRKVDPDHTEFVIADVAIAAAVGGPNGVSSRMVEHLVHKPEDVRVRLLLAHWFQSIGRTQDALSQYRHLIRIRPERLHPWVMAALLLQTSGQQDELNSLLQQMSRTSEVSAHAVRLRWQMASFAIRLRQNGADFKQAIEAFDLLHEDASQSSADRKLMVTALLAVSGKRPRHVVSQLEFALAADKADPAADEAILDRLESGMLLALINIAETDAADMEQRIVELVEKYPTQAGPRIAAIVYFAPRRYAHVAALIERYSATP